jgi:phage shock protein C
MDKFFSIVRGFGLKRGPQRWLGGVLGGIAAQLNVDVAYVRNAADVTGLCRTPHTPLHF